MEEDYDDERNGLGEAGQLGDDDEDDEENESVGARPRRISQLASFKTQKPIPKASSLFIFSYTNSFRVFCNKIVNHSIFTNCVLGCILLSSSNFHYLRLVHYFFPR